MRSLLLLLALSIGSTLYADQTREQPPFSDEQTAFFENEVLPLLQRQCFSCHGGQPVVEGEFRITSRAGLLEGGELGPAVDLDDPKAGELLAAINYESLEMPPDGKLPAEQIAVLSKWIHMGLPWSGKRDYGVEPQAEKDTRGDGRDYWAYQPLARPTLPNTSDRSWIKNPIDAFILARLDAAGLTPNPPAAPVTLEKRSAFPVASQGLRPRVQSRWQRESGSRTFRHLCHDEPDG